MNVHEKLLLQTAVVKRLKTIVDDTRAIAMAELEAGDMKRPRGLGSVSLSDTVGFIRDLPHGLVDAFQATFQEAVDADLLLHVVDAANPAFPEQIAQVQLVLGEIGAADIPQLLVFNKLDALTPEVRPNVRQDTYELDGRAVPRIFVSAGLGEGVADLRQLLADMVQKTLSSGMPPETAAEFKGEWD